MYVYTVVDPDNSKTLKTICETLKTNPQLIINKSIIAANMMYDVTLCERIWQKMHSHMMSKHRFHQHSKATSIY